MGLDDLVNSLAVKLNLSDNKAIEAFKSGIEGFNLNNLVYAVPAGFAILRWAQKQQIKLALKKSGTYRQLCKKYTEKKKKEKQDDKRSFTKKYWPEIASFLTVAPAYTYLLYPRANYLVKNLFEGNSKFELGDLIAFSGAALAYPLMSRVYSFFEKSQLKGNLNYLAAISLNNKFTRKKSLRFYENYAKLSDTSVSHREYARALFAAGNTTDAFNQLYAAMNTVNKSQLERLMDKQKVTVSRDMSLLIEPDAFAEKRKKKLSDFYFMKSLIAQNLDLREDSLIFADMALKKEKTPEGHLFKAALHENFSQPEEQRKELISAFELLKNDWGLYTRFEPIKNHDVFRVANNPLLSFSYIFKKGNQESLQSELTITKTFENLLKAYDFDENQASCVNFIDMIGLNQEEKNQNYFSVFKYEKGNTLYESDQKYVVNAAALLGFFHASMPLQLSQKKSPELFMHYSTKILNSKIPFQLKTELIDNSEFCFTGVGVIETVLNKDAHQHNWIISDKGKVIMLDMEDKGVTDFASDLCKLIFQAQQYNPSILSEAVDAYVAEFNRTRTMKNSQSSRQIDVGSKELESMVLSRLARKAVSYFCFAEDKPNLEVQAICFLEHAYSACIDLVNRYDSFLSYGSSARILKTASAIKSLIEFDEQNE